MIIEQILSKTRIKHYSDRGMMIRQIETGIIYEEAEDNIPCRYTYEETNEPISSGEPTAEDYEAALERLGVNINDEE